MDRPTMILPRGYGDRVSVHNTSHVGTGTGAVVYKVLLKYPYLLRVLSCVWCSNTIARRSSCHPLLEIRFPSVRFIVQHNISTSLPYMCSEGRKGHSGWYGLLLYISISHLTMDDGPKFTWF